MEINREVLLSIRTTIESKGPYKLQISKNDYIVSTFKIRMRDDVTHITQLTQGDFNVKVLKQDKEFLINSMNLPNFESGSQIKINISDTEIEINLDGVVKYKTVDEFMDIINDGTKKKSKKVQENRKAKSKPKQIQVQPKASYSPKERKQVEPAEAKPVIQTQNIKTPQKNDEIYEEKIREVVVPIDISNFVTKDEYESKINEITNYFNEQISILNNNYTQVLREVNFLKCEIQLMKETENKNEKVLDLNDLGVDNLN